MPTPAKTSRPQLLAIARRLVVEHGAEALTVSAVAQSAGVKAPSLYKHFADRLDLFRGLEIDILAELEAVLRAGTQGRTPGERLRSMAATYRHFARSNPHLYAILYSRDITSDPELVAACLSAAQPLFAELRAAGVPEERIGPLSRTLTAFLHGFVSMEIVNAFRLGGDLDSDFALSLDTILEEVDRMAAAMRPARATGS